MKRAYIQKHKLPDSPGIYIFRGRNKKILYIGKATSLRDRVRSYFASDVVKGRGERIVGMVAEATSLSYKKTDSVLEALILEANLIKRYQPPYNVDEKDNKSFNYVVITKDGPPAGGFPRVLPVRGRELYQGWDKADIKYLFGPFPAGGSLKEALKIVRKIFPYADTCTAGKGKPCFNRQIGLCPGVCSGEITKQEYAHTIRNIRELFSGNFHGLKSRLAREMRAAAAHERFEEAATLRRQISALEHIRDVSLIRNESRVASGGGARIEAFDVAHTSGHETVAVMTVVSNGEPIKAAYRKFKIQTATNDDVAALKEALSRRLAHTEWPLPRVFVVDGGKAQVRAAERVLKDAGISIPIVGVVKNEFHKPERLIGDKRAIEAYERDMLLANSEAHRFAIQWHRRRRRLV
jgi:excinuclease ABC subunit C